MLAYLFAVGSYNVAFFCGKILRKEVLKIPFADKANPRGILLFRRRKPVLVGDFANFCLIEFSERKEYPVSLLLRQLI